MKVAIIGTSPICVILSKILSSNTKNLVHNFELSQNIGGAWSCRELLGKYTSGRSNIIFPYSGEENVVLNSLDNFILKRGLAHNFCVNTNYKPPVIVDYDISTLFLDFERGAEVLNLEVFRVEEKNGVVILNDQYIYDRLYIPTHAKVDSVIINSKLYVVPYSLIVSKHLLVLTKENLNLPYYKEKKMGALDRVQYKRHVEGINVLTGRVSPEYKYENIDTILDCFDMSIDKRKIIYKDLSSYNNYYRNPEKASHMSNCFSFSSCIEYLDTAQFATSYMKLVQYPFFEVGNE